MQQKSFQHDFLKFKTVVLHDKCKIKHQFSRPVVELRVD